MSILPDHLYLRISPLVGALVMILVVTVVERAGRHSGADPRRDYALLTLLVMPPLFYRRSIPSEDMTRLRGQYRQHPDYRSWGQWNPMCACSSASDRYRQHMEKTKRTGWMRRRGAELTALSQALMLLIGGIAVIVILLTPPRVLAAILSQGH